MFREEGQQTYTIKFLGNKKSREELICRELLNRNKVLTCTVPVYRDFKKSIGKYLF